MPIAMQRAARINCRRLIALALVGSFLFPAAAHAQENLPGLVSGKQIAVLAAIGAAVIVTLFWLAKRSKNKPANPTLAPLAPAGVEFGAMQVGEPTNQLVTLANTTSQPVTLDNISSFGPSLLEGAK